MRRSLAILVTTLVLTGYWFSACSFKEPVFPAWETTFRVPFAVDKYVLGERLLERKEFIVKDPSDTNRVLWLSINDSLALDKIEAQDFTVEPEDVSESLVLDTIKIDRLDAIVAPQLSLRTLMPELENLLGQTVTLPDTTIPGTLPVAANNFRRAFFQSGTLRLRVTNNLPVTVGNSSAPGLLISVVSDSLPNDPFAEILFDAPLAAGAVVERETVVENRWLYAPLRLVYALPLTASAPLTITDDLLDNFGLGIEIELEDVRTSELVAIIEPQAFTDTLRVAYDSETQLREALIREGRTDLHIVNSVDLAADMTLTIPAFRNAQNQPYTDTFTLPARDTFLRVLNLNGYEIVNPDQPGELIDSLEIHIFAQTIENTEFVHLQSSDSVSFEVINEPLIFESFSGQIAEQVLDIEPQTEENVIDYRGFEGEVTIDEAMLILNVFSEIFVEELTADIRIVALKEDDAGNISDSVAIELSNQQINGGTPGAPGRTAIILEHDEHPEVLDVVNLLPTGFRFSGSLRARGEVAVALDSRIWAEYSFETPIRARITGLATFTGDPDTLTARDIDEEIRDAAEEDVLEGTLSFVITNHTPLGVEMRFIISADPTDENLYDADYDSLLTIIETFQVDGGAFDPQTGFVTVAEREEITIRLNQRQIQLFQDVPLFFGYEYRFPPTDNFVTLRYSDFVNILGEAQIRVRMDEESQ